MAFRIDLLIHGDYDPKRVQHALAVMQQHQQRLSQWCQSLD